MDPLDVVRHLVGMQAQLPLNPYVGLWSRVDEFGPAAIDEVGRLLTERQLVRIVVMRGTIHLLTAEDALLLRPLSQPVLDAELARHRDLGAVDLDAVITFIRPLLDERPLTGAQIRALLTDRFPGCDAAELFFAIRIRLALVQIPPRGVWGQSMQVTLANIETWLGHPLARPAPDAIDGIVLRYLAAFGPASVADIAAWSRLTGQRAVADRLRDRLRVFHDPNGRELFDLADATIIDPDTPAPTRFLPEYDNVMLSHADRTRVMSEVHRRRLVSPVSPVRGTVLYDGFLTATWQIENDPTIGSTTLIVRHADPMRAGEADEITAEGLRLLELMSPGSATHEVRLTQADG